MTDIHEAGSELIRATHATWIDPASAPAKSTTWGMVGFIRAGDAWTAVELLRSTPTGPELLWSPFDTRDLRHAPGIQMDSVWQVSHYGGRYDDMIPEWLTPKPVSA